MCHKPSTARLTQGFLVSSEALEHTHHLSSARTVVEVQDWYDPEPDEIAYLRVLVLPTPRYRKPAKERGKAAETSIRRKGGKASSSGRRGTGAVKLAESSCCRRAYRLCRC